MIDQFIQ